VRTRQQAFHHVENRIATLIEQQPSPQPFARVVDLGCGVGASLCYLAERLPIRGTGVTLSPVQAQMATARISAAQLSATVTCIEGDYTALPVAAGNTDLAYAIESFVHGPSPARFFEQCGRLLRPGGTLVICDDFSRGPREPHAARAIDRFRHGWHINTLITGSELRALAHAAGFEREDTVDLTPFLELGRARDRAIAVIAALLERLPIDRTRVDYLLGGSALQTCLARGWIGYDFVVFRRKVATTGR
jgi:cyclopropane fatty-acyl-phospholipid synthase-like methyltransferase